MKTEDAMKHKLNSKKNREQKLAETLKTAKLHVGGRSESKLKMCKPRLLQKKLMLEELEPNNLLPKPKK